nr:hypothetical protein MFLOJ_39250 [Mycobacterium florentinum]
MSNELQGKTIAILAADGAEKVELERPGAAMKQAGALVEVLRCRMPRWRSSTGWYCRAAR